MSRSGGIPLSRPRRGPVSLAERILDSIPYDGWVTAGEIAARVGVKPRKAAMVIHHRLLQVHVERRRERPRAPSRYLYRRLLRVSVNKDV